MELPLGTGEKPLKFLLIDHCAALPKGHDAFPFVENLQFFLRWDQVCVVEHVACFKEIKEVFDPEWEVFLP